jgi:hypothetical protein
MQITAINFNGCAAMVTVALMLTTYCYSYNDYRRVGDAVEGFKKITGGGGAVKYKP